jgi:hypothetical protein
MPGGPRSTPSGVRPYSGGRSESRSGPAGGRVPKPRSPPVSEARPGSASRAESPAFQAPRKPVRAARRKPRPTLAVVRKRAVRGAEVRLKSRRRRTSAGAAGGFRSVSDLGCRFKAHGPSFGFTKREAQRYGNLPEPGIFGFSSRPNPGIGCHRPNVRVNRTRPSQSLTEATKL